MARRLLTCAVHTWTRYVFGVVICSFVMFPIVGFGAFGVIPFDDFCQGIPRTGADTSGRIRLKLARSLPYFCWTATISGPDHSWVDDLSKLDLEIEANCEARLCILSWFCLENSDGSQRTTILQPPNPFSFLFFSLFFPPPFSSVFCPSTNANSVSRDVCGVWRHHGRERILHIGAPGLPHQVLSAIEVSARCACDAHDVGLTYAIGGPRPDGYIWSIASINPVPMSLCTCYTMSSTDMAYPLCTCYSISGTDRAYPPMHLL
eukprot:1387354-Rhodomonas_salina.2